MRNGTLSDLSIEELKCRMGYVIKSAYIRDNNSISFPRLPEFSYDCQKFYESYSIELERRGVNDFGFADFTECSHPVECINKGFVRYFPKNEYREMFIDGLFSLSAADNYCKMDSSEKERKDNELAKPTAVQIPEEESETYISDSTGNRFKVLNFSLNSTVPHFHVFCGSKFLSKKISNSFGAKYALVIKDSRLFENELRVYHNDFLSGIVEYYDSKNGENPRDPNYFSKDIKYLNQFEYRIILRHTYPQKERIGVYADFSKYNFELVDFTDK